MRFGTRLVSSARFLPPYQPQKNMHPDQLLQTLQSLIDDEMGWYLRFPNHEDGGELEPFVWDADQQGELTPLKLMQSEGWVQEFEVDAVLGKWLAPERVGSVNGEQWLVPDRDRAEILIHHTAKAERAQLYQELMMLLQAQLQNLQALQFSHDSDYALVALVGQSAGQWLCVAPSVPHATQIDADSPIQFTSAGQSPIEAISAAAELEAQVQTFLSRLSTIRLYGYYGGGYNQTHDYKLIEGIGNSSEQAIEQAIRQAGLLEIGRFEALQPSDNAGEWANQFQQLNQFLQQTFAERWLYRFSFWNYEHFYAIGQDVDSNWGGVVLRSRFTYNP